MAKDVEVRYQSWAELIEDVRGQIEGRDSLDFERAARERTRRRRTAVAAGGRALRAPLRGALPRTMEGDRCPP